VNYGQLIKGLRIEKRLTLRGFCQELGLDPSNWSKVERGINPPTQDENILAKLVSFFGLAGDKRQEFMDAAAVAHSKLPFDIFEDASLRAKLPAYFRTMRGKEPEEFSRNLVNIVEKLRQRYLSLTVAMLYVYSTCRSSEG